MYGDEALQQALWHTRWVLRLQYPPEGSPAAEAAAAGVPVEGWPAPNTALQPEPVRLRQLKVRFEQEAPMPQSAPASGPGASFGSRARADIPHVPMPRRPPPTITALAGSTDVTASTAPLSSSDNRARSVPTQKAMPIRPPPTPMPTRPPPGL